MLDEQGFNKILIKGGQIVDGSGNPWFKSDIAIKNGRITKIGKLDYVESEKIIDAKGLVVAPGFIDAHSHSDITLLVNPMAESFVRQGITTVINGNCGNSPAPLKGVYLTQYAEENMKKYELKITWSTFADYCRVLEEKGIAINAATLVGHGNLRVGVMGEEGYSPKEPTNEELEEMKALLAQAMKEGAFGMSTGLVYPPGVYAKTDEIIELCKVVAKYGGIYATHIRGQGDQFIEAVKEAIEIGEKAGVPVQLSHHSPNPGMWGKTIESLRMIDEARARGVDVTCDKHGYVFGSTNLSTVLPPWAHEGGTQKLVERLRDPKLRERLKWEIAGGLEWPRVSPALHARAGAWENIIIIAAKNKELEGRSIRQIATSRGTDPFDTVFDILIEEEGTCSVKYPAYSEGDILRVFKHPSSMVSTDDAALAPYGILGRGKGHPKAYGTFPLMFRKYVRDLGVLTLEEAVRKMTSFPARRFGLWDRGLLAPGMWADIVIFNPHKISDKATIEEPYQYPEGIEYVIVNGKLVLDKGEHTGALPGKALRKTG
jgi:N-acyl-D-amino-acid deacylase